MSTHTQTLPLFSCGGGEDCSFCSSGWSVHWRPARFRVKGFMWKQLNEAVWREKNKNKYSHVKGQIGPCKETEFDLIILMKRETQKQLSLLWLMVTWTYWSYFSKFWIVLGQQITKTAQLKSDWGCVALAWWMLSRQHHLAVYHWISQKCCVPHPSQMKNTTHWPYRHVTPMLITMTFGSLWVRNACDLDI